MKKDRIVTIISNKEVAKDIYEMKLQVADFPDDIRGGQFIHIALPNEVHLLRRPFCIADFDEKEKTIDVFYAVVGEGTALLSTLEEGQALKALFPLGNGFYFDSNVKKVAMVGGGMGVAVLPAIPTADPNLEYVSFLGFANKNKVILVDELKKKGEVYIATDDGSVGVKGFVTSLLKQCLDYVKPVVIVCCGPEIMYKSLKKEMEGIDIPIYVSLERRMGCGIGACLVCNCKVKTANGEKYLRACADGPIFNLEDIVP